MHIVFIDFDDIKNPLLGAGQANATAAVGKELVRRGHQVTVYANRYPGYKDRFENGITYKHIGLNTPWIKVNNFFFQLFTPMAVAKLDSSATDIVIECFTAPHSTLFSPLFTKIPVVALPSMFNAAEFAKKYHFPFQIIEKFGAQFYKYILPYSEIDSKKIKSYNPTIQFKIVPQGVDETYFEIKRKKAKHILFLSRLDMQQKGIDLLLEAYAKIKDIVKYPLVIAGHGPDELKIKEIINNLKLHKSVKMVGSAYGAKKISLMSEALFTVFPSRHDEMCLWSIESLAAGLPMVAFDLPESKWLPLSVCLKATPFSTDEYAQLIIKATNQKTITTFQDSARNYARKFSWSKTVDQYEQFFIEILKKEGHHAK